MFTKLIDALKATRRTIVFTEGPDARILEAADRLIKDDLMNVILSRQCRRGQGRSRKGRLRHVPRPRSSIRPPMPAWTRWSQKMVDAAQGQDVRGRRAARRSPKGNYFGTMLVKMGKADALLGGADLLHCRHCPSGAAAGQDEEGRTSGVLRLHSLPRGQGRAMTRSTAWATAPSTSTMRIASTRRPAR